jgi:transposase
MHHNIILTTDYHDQNCVIRWLDEQTGKEQVYKIATDTKQLSDLVARAEAVAKPRGGRVVWIQESTTGWARVEALLGRRVVFHLANVVQMPLPPKARRRKTDQIDTARLQRAYRNGELPLAHRPPAWWRQVRRLVALRENLVSRRTALRNWLTRYLAHETWAERTGLWSQKGRRRLQQLAEAAPRWDRLVWQTKLDELDQLAQRLDEVQAALHAVFQTWPQAQRLDAIAGIGVIAATSIVARIGPIGRFASPEQLIAYAGLAPGVQQSDQTRRSGRIGGGGTDRHLRHYLIEATIWARHIPRYRSAYERTSQRRGAKIGRLVVARMLLRSIWRLLRKGEAFTPTAPIALNPTTENDQP